jgi:hypothetical protein
VNEMSDPTIPAGLAALLQEPGWREGGRGFILERHPSTGRAAVSVCLVDGKWWSALVTDSVTVMTYDEVEAIAYELRRIARVVSDHEAQADMVYLLDDEAALAPEGTE